MKSSSKKLLEVNKYIFLLIFYTISHINAHTHNSLIYLHSMCTKTNSLHSQYRKTLGGYLNHYEHIYNIVILSDKCRLSRSTGIPTQVCRTPHSSYGLYDMQVDRK